MADAEPEHMYDERFEFDAPRFYDFEAMTGDTPADKWFETAPEGPGRKPERAGTSREPFKELQDNASNKQQQDDRLGKRTAVAAAAAAAGAAGDEAGPSNRSNTAAAAAAGAGEPAEKAKKPNIVTSWRRNATSAGRKSAAAHEAAVQGVPGAKAGGSTQVVSAAAASSGPSQDKDPRHVASVSAAAASRSGNSGARQRVSDEGVRPEPPVTRSMTRLGVALFSPVPEHQVKHASTPVTRSRTAAQRFYTVQKGKSTSTRTVKQPASVQKLHHVLLPKVTKPARSTKPLTLPDDFELQTTKRCQTRSGAAAAAGAPAGGAPEKSPFKPLAEKVREFQYKTPPRFKGRASKAATSKKRSPITKAEAPQLRTSLRSRPPAVKSQAEIDEEQLEQIRREQFKAKPLDTRVLTSSGQLGVPKVEKPRPTEPKPFHLRSDSRAKMRRSHEQPSMQQAAAAAGGRFKAQPLNRSILDGPTFLPHREKAGATKAASPELLTKKRALAAGSSAERGHRPDRPLTRSHAEHISSSGPKPTRPQPFSLATEARGVQHQQEMSAKLAAEEAHARRLRRVTARPLPVTVDVPVVPPKPDTKPLTLPDPFELKSLARHEEFEQQHRQQLQQEEEEARHAAEFKARPIPTAGPFVVHESDAPLTVPVDPHLATDSRAAERAGFDAEMADKMRRREEERRRQEEVKRRQEEEAVREYRKKLRFSARPMPNFSETFHAQPSERPLTNPQTPNFASKKLKKAG